MQIDPKRFYIFDCNDNMIGNVFGYKNHSIAQAQTSRTGASIHSKIWREFSKARKVNPKHNMIYAIKAGGVFA